MYTLKRSCVLFAVLMMAAGCSNSLVFLNKAYKCPAKGAALAIIPPFGDALIVHNEDDVYDDFGGDKRDAKSIVADSLYKYILKEFHDSLVKKVRLVRIDTASWRNWKPESWQSVRVEKRLGKDSAFYAFFVPEKDSLAPPIPKNVNIVVVINRVEITRTAGNWGKAGAFTNAMATMTYLNGGGNPPTLDADVHYIAWDYDRSEMIGCGEITVSAGILISCTDTTWRNLFSHIGSQILRNLRLKRAPSPT
jgi:hypothetical protein